MKRTPRSILLVLAVLLSPAAFLLAADDAPRPDAATDSATNDTAPKVNFNRDIRPILSDNCFACHGPDAKTRKAKLRLDTQEGATRDLGGYRAIEPGNVEFSELAFRITSEDKIDMMPPPESGKELEPHEIDLLKRWIAQGAPYAKHWAYTQPVRAAPPAAEKLEPKGWANGDIDHFILHRLNEEKLRPSPDTDRVTLIRRLHFDLVGLPPTPAEVERFINDDSPDAYEKLVDRLLASPHFGERLAIYWLDLVRFADTVGYHGDQDHNISPYRDYVIKSFNDNKPFDQFTIEQLAGDLLESPTLWQKIATGYNRMLQTSHEGGVQPGEYLAKYMADRVRNVSEVWLGSTMGCAECHDHKYDPITAVDFYAMGAFFADVDEAQHFKVGSNSLPTKRPPEIMAWNIEQYEKIKELDEQIAELEKRIEARLKELDETKQVLLTRIKQRKKAIDEVSKEKTKTRAELRGIMQKAYADQAAETEAKAKSAEVSRKLTKLTEEWAELLVQNTKDRHAAAEIETQKTEAEVPVFELIGKRKAIEDQFRLTMVTQSIEPREIRLLPRGDWLNKTGPVVQPAIPAFLGKLDTDGRATRLDLAKWITSRDNPLTARVFVNRLWAIYFGRGLCSSLDDFGAQGEAPEHPQLLDYLAVDFMEHGWDVKRTIKQIVTSRAYRQSSLTPSELRQRDPQNRLFARQSRFRLPAELVRDNALLLSGLLNEAIGGHSVKPYQPLGYYQHLNFPRRQYEADLDERQYRRGLYMHWQRQFLHPMLRAFDAPMREECTAQRSRSNTPLAALVLLNDPTFVEAGRAFAVRIMTEGGDAVDERIKWAWRTALSRQPEARELAALRALYEADLADYRADAEAAKQLLSVGMHRAPEDLNVAELAAWTSVARAVLNLNETITRN